MWLEREAQSLRFALDRLTVPPALRQSGSGILILIHPKPVFLQRCLLALRMDKMNVTCVVDVEISSSKLGPALVEVEKLLFKLGLELVRLGFVAVIGLRTAW